MEKGREERLDETFELMTEELAADGIFTDRYLFKLQHALANLTVDPDVRRERLIELKVLDPEGSVNPKVRKHLPIGFMVEPLTREEIDGAFARARAWLERVR